MLYEAVCFAKMTKLNEKTQKLHSLYNNNKVPNWKNEEKTKTVDARPKSKSKNDSKDKEVHLPKLKPEGGVDSTSGKYDCCAFIIHCTKHNKVLVCKQENVVWMPFTPLPPNR